VFEERGYRHRRTSPPEAVLDTVLKMVEFTDFERVLVADISAASGVGNGTIYHHFGSKAGILRALVGRISHEYRVAVFARHEIALPVAHLGWVEENRLKARLLARYGRLPCPPDQDPIDHAIQLAPAQRVCELWLEGRLPGRPSDYAERLSRS
jgi:AcrR family transcriptional regulator